VLQGDPSAKMAREVRCRVVLVDRHERV